MTDTAIASGSDRARSDVGRSSGGDRATKALPGTVASAWKADLGTAVGLDASAAGTDRTAAAEPPHWQVGEGDCSPSLRDRVGDYALLATAAAAALTLVSVFLSRVNVALEIGLIALVSLSLVAGHVLLRTRRQRRAAELDARHARRELALRTLVADGEARENRLAAFSELAAQIAHEIRNPLSSIVLNSELLKDEVQACAHASPEARRLAAAVCAEAERLSELTNEYLAFSRFPRPVSVPQPLGPLVEETVRFCRTAAEQAGVALAVEGEGSAAAAVDARLVRQALLNLIRNSIDALGGKGGAASLRVGGDGGRVWVDVIDTGPGVPASMRESLFEPFTSTKAHGTGLGLAVARKVARDHGGDLHLLPSAVGAHFRLELPAGPAGLPAPQDPGARR